MAKNIIKEIIIVLLLALAIILILGVLLYEYVPSNKIVPEQISYVTPEKARQEIADMELNSDILDENSIPPYTISAADLKNYEKVQEYVPGKKNPFSSIEKENTVEGNTTQETTGSGQTTTNSKNENSTGAENVNDNTTGYVPDKGTK